MCSAASSGPLATAVTGDHRVAVTRAEQHVHGREYARPGQHMRSENEVRASSAD